ncbi:MAG: AAA family ATPase [Bacteroidaceae bacterium]|nr:AAA family ATPase [Bacteroidaceae bacterium]
MIKELENQRALLRQEFEYERAQFRLHTQQTGVGRKVRRGLCWFPLTVGRHYYNSLNQLVVELTRTEALDVEHTFEPGKPVCFFRQDEKEHLHYFKFQGQVSYVDGDRMVVAVPTADAVLQLENCERLGVQLYLDEYTYRLMFDALDRVIQAKTGRLAELRDIFHTSAPLHKFTFDAVRFPWLNPSQEQAVNEVLWAKDVAVVHGPPGTGKTTTLVEAIYETLHRESQVLVCAQSNMAVDWISEKLADRGVAVLRIGNPSRVTDKMLSFTYERRFEAHPRYTDLWTLRREIRLLYDSKQSRNGSFHQKIARLKERCTEIEFSIHDDLFREARVVACTLTGAAHHLLLGKRFATVFIDEAAQALEASCWIAIQRADRVVLAGDHRQLPPTLKSPEALKGGLDKTLMQTIVENKPKAVSLLTVQYRMCDGIMEFPNREFYNGRLQSDPSVRYRGILDWDTPIDWVDYETHTHVCDETSLCVSSDIRTSEVTHKDVPTEPSAEPDDWHETVAGDGQSRQNPAEAALTLQTLRNYFEKIGKDRILYERIDTGLISPYRGQVQLLRRMVKRDPYWKPYRHLLTINTVDGFQGQERDIIVISMVRSNDEGQVGFLRDLRRMNVAITRARMKLVLIGNKQTLCRHPFYRRLAAYVEGLTP